jgi:hypothetical protein
MAMTNSPSIDSVLVQWGERLFYPPNRIVKAAPTPRLDTLTRRKAAVIRRRIEALVVRRAPEVMVKVVGGGRGMRAIASQFNYITRNASLEMEDDRAIRSIGMDDLKDRVEQWRYAGSLIDEVSWRREALNVTLSMPRGTDPERVLKAARAFARAELADSRYVFVLHKDRDHPHVHLIVRGQSRTGERLNVWTDRQRWRETFAAQLRHLGVDAEATSQACRGANRKAEPSWRRQAREMGARPEASAAKKSGDRYYENRVGVMHAWSHIMTALARSPDAGERELAHSIAKFVRDTPFVVETLGPRVRPSERKQERVAPTHADPNREGARKPRTRPDIER